MTYFWTDFEQLECTSISANYQYDGAQWKFLGWFKDRVYFSQDTQKSNQKNGFNKKILKTSYFTMTRSLSFFLNNWVAEEKMFSQNLYTIIWEGLSCKTKYWCFIQELFACSCVQTVDTGGSKLCFLIAKRRAIRCKEKKKERKKMFRMIALVAFFTPTLPKELLSPRIFNKYLPNFLTYLNGKFSNWWSNQSILKKIHWFKNISPLRWLLNISFLQLETKSKMYCLVVTTDKTTHCYSLLYYYSEIY